MPSFNSMLCKRFVIECNESGVSKDDDDDDDDDDELKEVDDDEEIDVANRSL